MSDIPDALFLSLLQVHPALDADTVAKLRATQAQWVAQGRPASLFQLAWHHSLLQPQAIQGFLQLAAQQAQQAQQARPTHSAKAPVPPQTPLPSDPPSEGPKPSRPRAPAKRSASSRLAAGRSSQRNTALGRRPTSQRMASKKQRGSLLHLHVGAAVIGCLIAVLGYRVLSSPEPEVATEPPKQAVADHTVLSTKAEESVGSAEVEPSEDEPQGTKDGGGPGPIDQARKRYASALEHLEAGDQAGGRQGLLEALRIVEERAPEDPLRGLILVELTNFYWYHRSTREYERRAREALQFVQRVKPREVALALQRLSVKMLNAGNRELGVLLHVGILESCRDELTPAERVEICAALSMESRLDGDFPTARGYIERAKAALEGTTPDDEPRAWYQLYLEEGEFFYRSRSHDLAQRAYERAMALADRAIDPASLTALANRSHFAAVLSENGDLPRARTVLEESIQGLKRLDASDARVAGVMGSVLGLLAAVEEREGNLQRAFELYMDMNARRRKAGRLTAEGLNNAGAAAFNLEQPALAIQLWQESLSLQDLSVPRMETVTTVSNLAVAFDSLGKTEDALQSHMSGHRVLQKCLDRTVRSLTPAERLQAVFSQQESVGCWLDLTRNNLPRQTGYEGALRIRGYLTRASEVLRRTLRRDAEHRARLAELDKADRTLTDLLYSKPQDPQAASKWERAVEQARSRRDRLNVALSTSSPTWKVGQTRLRAGVQDVQARLGAGQLLVDYVRRHDKYVAFVVRPEGDMDRFELGTVQPIEAACERFHALASKPIDPRKGSAELDKAAAALHALIWKPLVKAVAGATFVYVVPDGPLATVPFSALPGSKPGTVLYQDHPIGFLAHPQDLLPWPDAPKPGRGALAMGGVDYDRAAVETPEGFMQVPPPRRITLEEAIAKAPGGMGFSPLQGTLLEARACLEYFSRATKDKGWLLHGPLATEEHLRRYAPGRRLLHLATHGFVRLDLADEARDGKRIDPLLLTGLALAGCNRTEGGGEDDGVLTAHEAAQLNLDGVELVILSACETARGSARAGEAVIGLTSAFREAGATTVVSSLWPVSDQATAMMMELFYRLVLVEEVQPPVALQTAALALRDFEVEHEGKALRPFAAPCFWSPFVSYGTFR